MTWPKVTFFAAILLATFCTHLNAGTVSLVDAALNNGDFDANFTDPANSTANFWGYTAQNNAGGALAVTVNGNGRGLISSSQTGSQVIGTDWVMERVSYPGANAAYGFDGGNGAFGATPNPYIFVNSGSISLTNSTITQAFSAGDMICLDFDLFSGNSGGNAIATIDFGNGETHTFSTATTTGGTALDYVAPTYTVMGAASQVTLTILLDTGSSGNQTLIDNVNLGVTPIPEPTAFALLFCSMIGLLAARRR